MSTIDRLLEQTKNINAQIDAQTTKESNLVQSMQKEYVNQTDNLIPSTESIRSYIESYFKFFKPKSSDIILTSTDISAILNRINTIIPSKVENISLKIYVLQLILLQIDLDQEIKDFTLAELKKLNGNSAIYILADTIKIILEDPLTNSAIVSSELASEFPLIKKIQDLLQPLIHNFTPTLPPGWMRYPKRKDYWFQVNSTMAILSKKLSDEQLYQIALLNSVFFSPNKLYIKNNHFSTAIVTKMQKIMKSDNSKKACLQIYSLDQKLPKLKNIALGWVLLYSDWNFLTDWGFDTTTQEISYLEKIFNKPYVETSSNQFELHENYNKALENFFILNDLGLDLNDQDFNLKVKRIKALLLGDTNQKALKEILGLLTKTPKDIKLGKNITTFLSKNIIILTRNSTENQNHPTNKVPEIPHPTPLERTKNNKPPTNINTPPTIPLASMVKITNHNNQQAPPPLPTQKNTKSFVDYLGDIANSIISALKSVYNWIQNFW